MPDDPFDRRDRFELHLDGQTAGWFATARGLDAEDVDTAHLPGLRRAITVALEDGRLDAEYEEWLEYGRSQVGKHGEIAGPDERGVRTRWIFEEGWPTRVVEARSGTGQGLALASLHLEIEVVTTTTEPPVAPAPPATPQVRPGAARRPGFWKRLFGRR